MKYLKMFAGVSVAMYLFWLFLMGWLWAMGCLVNGEWIEGPPAVLLRLFAAVSLSAGVFVTILFAIDSETL